MNYLKFLTMFNKGVDKKQNEYADAVSNLMSIDISLYSRIHSPDYSLISITVPFSDIETFNIIRPTDRNAVNFKTVFISSFFINEKGYYVDYQSELNKFIKLGIELLEYVGNPMANQEDDIYQNNRRMLHDIALNITSLSKGFLL